ncbi:hypothetical protein CXG81DRAFT_16366 [Caulochytrium protostelioides]|uniref:TRIP4/RQT4 C2HC5-type zinc finger domain-containing protein n=1 Tax=Caulochytrium protostelioides TaxID=1555241 RepID=A0A4P9XF83_9FUNG|nr:hypothetical protein CXG81DRAFT_16366 [Caulochytrium protostelioides]|eukprot:RKP04237.1 hypothetical protein CXG81DRAFT_16366 [Caulochytrium protostelioides]
MSAQTQLQDALAIRLGLPPSDAAQFARDILSANSTPAALHEALVGFLGDDPEGETLIRHVITASTRSSRPSPTPSPSSSSPAVPRGAKHPSAPPRNPAASSTTTKTLVTKTSATSTKSSQQPRPAAPIPQRASARGPTSAAASPSATPPPPPRSAPPSAAAPRTASPRIPAPRASTPAAKPSVPGSASRSQPASPKSEKASGKPKPPKKAGRTLASFADGPRQRIQPISAKQRAQQEAQQAARRDALPAAPWVLEGHLSPGLNGRISCECMATTHGLFNNCLSCGKIVCQFEGEGPCAFCGTPVYSREVQRQMMYDLTRATKVATAAKHRGAAAPSTLSAKTPAGHRAKPLAPYGRAVGGSAYLTKDEAEIEFPTFEETAKQVEELEAAERRTAALLKFQQETAQRSKIHDAMADYSYEHAAANQWLTPQQRAFALERDVQLKLEADAQRERPQHVLTLDIANRQATLTTAPDPSHTPREAVILPDAAAQTGPTRPRFAKDAISDDDDDDEHGGDADGAQAKGQPERVPVERLPPSATGPQHTLVYVSRTTKQTARTPLQFDQMSLAEKRAYLRSRAVAQRLAAEAEAEA